MIRLLEIEFLKIGRYPTFYWFIGAYALLLVLVFANFTFEVNEADMAGGLGMHTFPKVWLFLTYAAGFFNFIPVVLTITLITNEYSSKTFRQQVINGLTRSELVWGKGLLLICISILLTFFVLVLGFILGLTKTDSYSSSSIFQEIDAVGLYALQLFSYLSLAMLIAVLVRRTGIAIMIYLAYVYIIEPIIGKFVGDSISGYLPTESFSSLTPLPIKEQLEGIGLPLSNTPISSAILLSILYIMVFYVLALFIIKKRDL